LSPSADVSKQEFCIVKVLPLEVLAPFSGVGVSVSAYFPRPTDFQEELRIRIEIEDIFGNWQRLDVTARV
jgi:hypothetical protein